MKKKSIILFSVLMLAWAHNSVTADVEAGADAVVAGADADAPATVVQRDMMRSALNFVSRNKAYFITISVSTTVAIIAAHLTKLYNKKHKKNINKVQIAATAGIATAVVLGGGFYLASGADADADAGADADADAGADADADAEDAGAGAVQAPSLISSAFGFIISKPVLITVGTSTCIAAISAYLTKLYNKKYQKSFDKKKIAAAAGIATAILVGGGFYLTSGK